MPGMLTSVNNNSNDRSTCQLALGACGASLRLPGGMLLSSLVGWGSTELLIAVVKEGSQTLLLFPSPSILNSSSCHVPCMVLLFYPCSLFPPCLPPFRQPQLHPLFLKWIPNDCLSLTPTSFPYPGIPTQHLPPHSFITSFPVTAPLLPTLHGAELARSGLTHHDIANDVDARQ